MDIPLNTIFINYFDVIDQKKVKGLMAIVSDVIAQMKPNCLYFLISSSGGDVNAGVVLYNFLRALPIEIRMHNTGTIDSIANVIFLAGEKRYASVHSAFLFHGIQMNFPAQVGLSHNQLNEVLSRIQTDESKIRGIITDRTSLTEAEISDLFVQGQSKDPTFAIGKGVIHEIIDASIPKDAPVITVNIN